MKPVLGQKIQLFGGLAVIVAIRPFGTLDVELNGKFYRLTGLTF